jgi:hypothetical protein
MTDLDSRPLPFDRQTLDKFWMPPSPPSGDGEARLERLRDRRSRIAQQHTEQRTAQLAALVDNPEHRINLDPGVPVALSLLDAAINQVDGTVTHAKAVDPAWQQWRTDCSRRLDAWLTARQPQEHDTDELRRGRLAALVAHWT